MEKTEIIKIAEKYKNVANKTVEERFYLATKAAYELGLSQSKQEKPLTVEDIMDIFHDKTEIIGEDIDSLNMFAGTNVLTKDGMKLSAQRIISEMQPKQVEVSEEDVKRWFQLLVGKSKEAMYEDIAKTLPTQKGISEEEIK